MRSSCTEPDRPVDAVTAIEGMKKAFGLEAVWTGDPCLSLPYDWLNCSASPPRVTGMYAILTASKLVNFVVSTDWYSWTYMSRH